MVLTTPSPTVARSTKRSQQLEALCSPRRRRSASSRQQRRGSAVVPKFQDRGAAGRPIRSPSISMIDNRAVTSSSLLHDLSGAWAGNDTIRRRVHTGENPPLDARRKKAATPPRRGRFPWDRRRQSVGTSAPAGDRLVRSGGGCVQAVRWMPPRWGRGFKELNARLWRSPPCSTPLSSVDRNGPLDRGSRLVVWEIGRLHVPMVRARAALPNWTAATLERPSRKQRATRDACRP